MPECPWATKEKRYARKVVGRRSRQVRLMKVERLEHRRIWGLFRRMVRVAECPDTLWPVGCVSAIRGMAPKDFGRQRNHLHYRPNVWHFDDLHRLLVDGAHGVFPDGLVDGNRLDPDGEDFSVALAFVMVRMATNMLVDLATVSRGLASEVSLLRKWFTQDVHRLYAKAQV